MYQLIANIDGFVLNIEAEKSGNLISLLNFRGLLQAEINNWQEKVGIYAVNVIYGYRFISIFIYCSWMVKLTLALKPTTSMKDYQSGNL